MEKELLSEKRNIQATEGTVMTGILLDTRKSGMPEQLGILAKNPLYLRFRKKPEKSRKSREFLRNSGILGFLVFGIRVRALAVSRPEVSYEAGVTERVVRRLPLKSSPRMKL